MRTMRVEDEEVKFEVYISMDFPPIVKSCTQEWSTLLGRNLL